jgi:colanic acid/amylovoran biosynthesis glycosyltransferase
MADPQLRLAYLTSQYPATSHTFIRREIEAVRALGLPLETFSVRLPSPSERQDPAIEADTSATFTVLAQPLSTFLAAHLATLGTRPLAYARTLARALSHRPPGLRALGLSLAHFGEAVVLARELGRRRISRLHNHFANSGATVGFLAAQLVGIPWSFTMHGISETDYPAGLLLGRKISAADFVACVSYFGRAQAMRLVPPDQWSKLQVIRCGVPPPTAAKRRPASRSQIIAVGRLSPEKGQAGLLEAFANVIRGGIDAELTLVGDGPEGAVLHALADKLGIADRVAFAGRCSEQETLERIAAADLLVLSSFMEGLPIVIMEAMAAGTPVIASGVAGIPELVRDGQTGLLFPPSDWDELANCMRRLIGDAPLRKSLAKNGRAAVKTDFDGARSARQLRDLFLAKAKS